jgi:hypothetical protein
VTTFDVEKIYAEVKGIEENSSMGGTLSPTTEVRVNTPVGLQLGRK